MTKEHSVYQNKELITNENDPEESIQQIPMPILQSNILKADQDQPHLDDQLKVQMTGWVEVGGGQINIREGWW